MLSEKAQAKEPPPKESQSRSQVPVFYTDNVFAVNIHWDINVVFHMIFFISYGE